jgi:four helix bundle protein
VLINNNQKLQKDYWLQEQMKRSCISISSNIAEWYGRKSNTEFIRFLDIALWSLFEFKSQFYILFNIWYINKKTFEDFLKNIEEIEYMVKSLIKYLNSC